MKNIFSLFFLIIMACSSNSMDNNTTKNGQQKWKLVKMTGSFIGSETTGEDMEWQETIVLKENNIFVKSRVRNNSTTAVEGTYTYLDLEDGTYLELTFPEKSTLVGNCTGNLKETYWLISENKLQGTWLACDGPGLEYKPES